MEKVPGVGGAPSDGGILEISPRTLATLDYLDNADFLCTYTTLQQAPSPTIEWRKVSARGTHSVSKSLTKLKRYTLNGGLVMEHLSLKLRNVTEGDGGQYDCAVRTQQLKRALNITVKGKHGFLTM